MVCQLVDIKCHILVEVPGNLLSLKYLALAVNGIIAGFSKSTSNTPPVISY
jgi:hypothetical protein